MSDHLCCHYCGDKYSKLDWPRYCSSCNKQVWKNPLPVVVGVVPIQERYNATNHIIKGVLSVRRAILPDIGKLALVSGYVDHKEDWREAAVRELQEEANLSFTKKELKLIDVIPSKSREHMLVFFKTPPIYMPPSVSNSEVQELVLIKDINDLEWDAHRVMAKKVLKLWWPNVRFK